MNLSQSPPQVLRGYMGEFICFVDTGVTLQQLAIANKWQYSMSEISYLLDKITGLSRELSEDPAVLLTLSVNEQLVLILNHSTDGITTCTVIGDPEKAFSDFAYDENIQGLYYVDLRVDLDDKTMYVVDSFSRGSTLTEVITMNDAVNQELASLI